MYWHILVTVWFVMLMTYSPSSEAQIGKKPESFGNYIKQLKQEAIDSGVSEAFAQSNFSKIKLFKKAIASGPPQSKTKMTLETYIPKFVPEWKISKAKQLYEEHFADLERIGKKYGVQPRFIVALWAMESDFGEKVGSYPTLSVTASLAFEGNEEKYFKKEFDAALKIIEQDKIPFGDLKGSWSGAMGQLHLLPTAYLAYAQDGDGDGKKDIWSNTLDVFATAAFYLQKAGWNESETWGRQIRIPNDLDMELVGISHRKSFNQWQTLGVRRFNGSDLPKRDDMQVSLIMPDGIKGRKYLVYDNYRALLSWNKSHYFALSLTYLTEKIKKY